MTAPARRPWRSPRWSSRPRAPARARLPDADRGAESIARLCRAVASTRVDRAMPAVRRQPARPAAARRPRSARLGAAGRRRVGPALVALAARRAPNRSAPSCDASPRSIEHGAPVADALAAWAGVARRVRRRAAGGGRPHASAPAPVARWRGPSTAWRRRSASATSSAPRCGRWPPRPAPRPPSSPPRRSSSPLLVATVEPGAVGVPAHHARRPRVPRRRRRPRRRSVCSGWRASPGAPDDRRVLGGIAALVAVTGVARRRIAARPRGGPRRPPRRRRRRAAVGVVARPAARRAGWSDAGGPPPARPTASGRRHALPDLVDLLRLATTAGLTLAVAHPLVAPHVAAAGGSGAARCRRRRGAGPPACRRPARRARRPSAIERTRWPTCSATTSATACRCSPASSAPASSSGSTAGGPPSSTRGASRCACSAPLVTCVLPAFALLTVVPLLAASLEALPV